MSIKKVGIVGSRFIGSSLAEKLIESEVTQVTLIDYKTTTSIYSFTDPKEYFNNIKVTGNPSHPDKHKFGTEQKKFRKSNNRKRNKWRK